MQTVMTKSAACSKEQVEILGSLTDIRSHGVTSCLPVLYGVTCTFSHHKTERVNNFFYRNDLGDNGDVTSEWLT